MPSKKTFLSQETTEFGRKVFMNLFELLCRKRAEGKQMMRQESPTHHEPDGVTYTPAGYKWDLPSKSKK